MAAIHQETVHKVDRREDGLHRISFLFVQFVDLLDGVRSILLIQYLVRQFLPVLLSLTLGLVDKELVETVKVGFESWINFRVKIIIRQEGLLLPAQREVARLGKLSGMLIAFDDGENLIAVDERLLLADVLLVDRRQVLVGL